MDKPDINALAQKMIEAVRGFVARSELAISGRLDALDEKLKVMPAPLKGEPGEPGENGERGEKGEPGERGEEGLDGKDGLNAFEVAVSLGFEDTVHDWMKSLDGKPGEPGRSVTAEDVLPALKSDLQKAVESIPAPQNGRDADPEEVRKLVAIEVAKAVAAIPPAPKGDKGVDGASIHPDTVALMVSAAVEKAVAAIPRAKDGERGHDAIEIMVLPGIDESRSYPAGTYAKHNGGEIRAERRTDPVKDGDIFSAGWTVARDGISAVVFTQGDDPRVFEMAAMLTSGTKTIATAKIPVPIDRGVYRADQSYEKGDMVSYGGSSWIAQRDTQSKPETDDSWRLMVKRGRDGKDAAVERADKGPVRFR